MNEAKKSTRKELLASPDENDQDDPAHLFGLRNAQVEIAAPHFEIDALRLAGEFCAFK
jgi:hypothetical protein